MPVTEHETMTAREIIRLKNRALFLFFSLGLLLLVSCQPQPVYEDYYQLTKATWHQDSLLRFELDIKDSVQLYDLSFYVRNKGTYSFSNLWLFVSIYPPKGEHLADTLELTLSDPSGKWYGSGLGDLYDKQYPYKRQIFFPDTGKYVIDVKHGMRTKDGILEGINNFGMRVEKTN